MNLEPPRWPGGPAICPAANLPAFKTAADYAAFEAANCPGAKTLLKFTCKECGHIHVWSVASDPAGGSSGTTRTAKHFDALTGQAVKKFAHLIT